MIKWDHTDQGRPTTPLQLRTAASSVGARQKLRAVQPGGQPLNAALRALASREHRPKGYWKHKYLEKQENNPEKVAALQQEQDFPGPERPTAGRVPKPSVRCLDTLHPPPAPSLFTRDWLRTLLCEGCGLPATANVTKCLYCNIVVHNWCRELPPPSASASGARPRRPGRRTSSIARRRASSMVAQQQKAKLTPQKSRNAAVVDWVCWECEEDMVLDLQYYRRLKNRQKGANIEKRAAAKIIRFISWVADYKSAVKAEKRAIMIQSFVRMRIVYIRFRRWAESQKRAMVVAVRGASGLPVGDPISRKCHPYIILTVVENSKDDPTEQVETITHRLQTKKGGNSAASGGGSGGGGGGGNQHPHGALSIITQAGAIGHQHPHGIAGAKSISAAAPPKPAAAGGRKHPPGSREKSGAGKTYSFQWDEGFLLPGVSDSATIIFTVLHQAPTRLVCLGQALVGPKQFSKGVEHVRTVPLGKLQVAVPTGPQEARLAEAEWVRPGNLTFTIKKSSYSDAFCSEVNGPIVEEINTLALAERNAGGTGAGIGRRDYPGGDAATAADAAQSTNTTTSTNTGTGGVERDKGHSQQSAAAGTGSAAAANSPEPSLGGTKSKIVSHIKAGDLSTVWWACVWMGELKVFRHMGDAQAKLTLPLDRWSVAPLEASEGDTTEGRTAKPDLRLFCASPKRCLVLRCANKIDKQRWEEVIGKNQSQIRLAQKAPPQRKGS